MLTAPPNSHESTTVAPSNESSLERHVSDVTPHELLAYGPQIHAFSYIAVSAVSVRHSTADKFIIVELQSFIYSLWSVSYIVAS